MQPGISSFAFGWAVGTRGSPLARPFTAETLLDFAVAHRVPVIQFGANLPLHALTGTELDDLRAVRPQPQRRRRNWGPRAHVRASS